MDLEQLTLILDTIQSMGGDAKEFGIWWMICNTIPQLVGYVLLFLFGCLLVKGLVRVVRDCRDTDRHYIESQRQIRQEIRE